MIQSPFDQGAGNLPPQAGPGAHKGAARPTPAQSVKYTRSWMFFWMVLALVIAWLVPMGILINRWLFPTVDRGPRVSYAFMALAYEGVSAKTNEISPELFREHLNTLRQRGFVPISLDDVRDLVKYGKPVPAKAVLLTFDHSRKSSYYAVKSMLRHAGWNAVMFLWTKPINDSDPAALLWPYVRNLVQSRNWDVGAQSYNGFDRVPTDPFGGTGHYMTSRQWLDYGKRYETFDELAKRLDRDHETCLQQIELNTSRKPTAYAYPFGDFGQYRRREQQIKKINLNLVGHYYDLGFLTGNFACNTRSSDPRRLNRLRVRPEWSGEELVSRLERSWPRRDIVNFRSVQEAFNAWLVDWGSMEIVADRLLLQSRDNESVVTTNAPAMLPTPFDSRLVLKASERITGARMWMAASNARQDLYWRMIFRLRNGQMGVFLRGTPDEEQYVYLGIDTAGDVWLRQKYVGLDPFTLASTKIRLTANEDHVLEVFLRGKLFGAMLDGYTIFSERMVLQGDPEPGMVGLSVWDTAQGKACLEVADSVIQPQEPMVACWKYNEEDQPYYTQWIHRNGFRLTHLSPSWIFFSTGGQLSQAVQDSAIYSALSKIYRLALMPRVEIRAERWENSLSPGQLARSLQEIHADGILFDFSNLERIQVPALTLWLQQLNAVFQEQKLNFMIRLPQVLEKAELLQPIFALLPGLQIAVAEDSPVKDGVPGARNPPVRLETINPPATPAQRPYVYQLDPSAEFVRELSTHERIRLLQQEGRAALLANRYQDAITIWQQWHELEPSDPVPLMLIGDAQVRLGEIDAALDSYARSLDLDPGRISLAMRRAHLLELAGRQDEAVREINTYALLFPENSDVLIAQADWLNRHNRKVEARELINRALALKPDDIDVIVSAVRLSTTREDRRANLGRLLSFEKRPELHTELGEAIWKNELLSVPDGYLLLPMIDRIANSSSNQQVAAFFNRFKPLSEQVTETFALSGLSDSWLVEGGLAVSDTKGQLQMQADESHKEMTIQLQGTELVRDGMLEVGLQGNIGEFWLMARRGPDHFVRFGFDRSSMLFLQVWIGGQRVSNQKRYWTRSGQPATYRLEIRGYGAMGYVDGKPAFDAPVSLPREMGYGKWGLSIFAPRAGQAIATLNYLSAGPLPLMFALFPPPMVITNAEQRLTTAKSLVGSVSALVPRWFHWQSDGTLIREVSAEDDFLPILARFHGIKLYPAIEMAGDLEFDPQELLNKAQDLRLDGYLLMFSWMPPDSWFQNIETALEGSPLEILAIVMDEKKRVAQIRGIGPAISLFAGASRINTMDLRPWPDERAPDAASLKLFTKPTLLSIQNRPVQPPSTNPAPESVKQPYVAPAETVAPVVAAPAAVAPTATAPAAAPTHTPAPATNELPAATQAPTSAPPQQVTTSVEPTNSGANAAGEEPSAPSNNTVSAAVPAPAPATNPTPAKP